MVQYVVLQGGSESRVVNAVVRVESLVLGIDECFPEDGVDILVVDRCAVLTEELAYLLTVGTVDLRSLCRSLVLNHLHGRRLAEEPQEVAIDG